MAGLRIAIVIRIQDSGLSDHPQIFVPFVGYWRVLRTKALVVVRGKFVRCLSDPTLRSGPPVGTRLIASAGHICSSKTAN